MTQSAVRELTDSVNESLARSRSELLEYARQNRIAIERDLNEDKEVTIETKSGSQLRVRRDPDGRLRIA